MTLNLPSVFFDIFGYTLLIFGFTIVTINANGVYKDRIRSKPLVSTKRRVTRITIGVFGSIYGLVFLLISRFFLFL